MSNAKEKKEPGREKGGGKRGREGMEEEKGEEGETDNIACQLTFHSCFQRSGS